MTEFFVSTSRLSLFFIFIIQLSGCTPKKAGDTPASKRKYSIYAMMKNGREYIVQTDSIDSGFINPETQGTKVTPAPLYYDLIVSNGYYYRQDWKKGKFIRYEIRNNTFREVQSLQITGNWGIDNYNMIGGDSVLIIGQDQKTSKVRYAKINLRQMKAVEGTMEIPAPSGKFNSMSIGFSKFMGNKLYVGYSYNISDLNQYTTSDTIYVEVLSYPEMKSLRRFKDARSSYTGGINTRQSHFFTDEKGDFYFITCPGIALGNNPEKPTAIYRIRQSDGSLDPTYFFNISASPIQNHGYGFWYIGSGKAIVRTERKNLFTGMQDHYLVPHFDFYLLDLAKQTTSRLDLPLDKGTARQCVLVENGLVYITVNPNSGGKYVWIYNPKDGSLRKGLHFDDEVNYILRLERLSL